MDALLPKIEHPLSRLEKPETMSVRGISRAGHRSIDGNKIGVQHRLIMSPLRKDLDPKLPITSIPEGVEVTQAMDPKKPTLPVFGKNIHFTNQMFSENEPPIFFGHTKRIVWC